MNVSLIKSNRNNYSEINRYIKGTDSSFLQKELFRYITDVVQEGGSIDKYSVLPSKPNINENKNNCVSMSLTRPTMSQFIFHQLAHRISRGWNKKGLLGWLSTGAGKTIIAAGIYDAFYNTNKDVYYISRHDAIKPHEEIFKYLKPIWNNHVEMKDFKKRFKIMSIASFSNGVKSKKIDMNNLVVIIDEAQYLFANRAVPMLKTAHNYLIQRLTKSSDSTNIFILTATPGDSLKELITLLNLLNLKKDSNINESNYKSRVSDKVVYLDMYKDETMFPKVSGKFSNNIVVKMEGEQKERYIEKLLTKNTDKTLQKWSNELYTGKGVFSNKIKKMYEMIDKKKKEKHFVYSQYYKQGISDFIKYIESRGYKRATKANIGRKGKKYLLAKASENFVVSDEKNEILRGFNSEKNKNGEYIQLFIATDSYNTGVDLKAVRHIHFMEPTFSFLDTIQGIGRGARVCSHKHLDKSDWSVQVYTYFSELGDPEKDLKEYMEKKYKKGRNQPVEKMISIDDKVYKKMFSNYLDFFTKMNPLRSNAIDCRVMSFFHNQGLSPSDPGYIVCGEGNADKSVYETKPGNKILSQKRRKEIEDKLAGKRKLMRAAERAKKMANEYKDQEKAVSLIRKAFNEQKSRYSKAMERKTNLIATKKRINGVSKMKEVLMKQKEATREAVKYAKKLAEKKKEMNKEQERLNRIAKKKKEREEERLRIQREMEEIERRKRAFALERQRRLDDYKRKLKEKEQRKKENKKQRNNEVKSQLKRIRNMTTSKINTGLRKRINKIPMMG